MMCLSPNGRRRGFLAILDREPTDAVIAVLAAGRLEDLIDEHGPAFIDRIELQARRHPRFRHLLGGGWQSGTEDVWNRVLRSRGNVVW